MQLIGRHPGSLTRFVDTSREEVLLQLQADAAGLPLIGFTIYDSSGVLVADAPELRPYPDGVAVRSADDELLFAVLDNETNTLVYRLYNHLGVLLTTSDGVRTQIYGYLRMDGNKVGGHQYKPRSQSADAPESAIPVDISGN